MSSSTPKIIVFEQEPIVRRYVKAFLENYGLIRDNFVIEAENEPWNAKDQITPDTALAMIGDSRGVRGWDALSYLKEAPDWLVSIAGSPCWSPEERDEFVRAGALFTYDRPFNAKGLEALVKTALKIGPVLKQRAVNANELVTIHLPSNYDGKNGMQILKMLR